MTTLTYTLAALSALPDGRYPVHLYIRREEPTNTELVSRERKAADDAELVLQDTVRSNVDDEEMLLRRGDMPDDAIPIFVFALGVSWDRDAKMARYNKIDYRRVLQNRKWHKVASLGMELYEQTYDIVHRREKIEAKGRPAKINLDGLTEARKRFSSWADGLLADAMRRFRALEANADRAICDRRHGDQCSPCRFECPNYINGKCVELPL